MQKLNIKQETIERAIRKFIEKIRFADSESVYKVIDFLVKNEILSTSKLNISIFDVFCPYSI
mgnify:CR=1 FL=1